MEHPARTQGERAEAGELPAAGLELLGTLRQTFDLATKVVAGPTDQLVAFLGRQRRALPWMPIVVSVLDRLAPARSM